MRRYLPTLLLQSARGSPWAMGLVMPINHLHISASLQMPDVVVPHLGESVSEGSISTVLKKQGDSVAVDDVVAQLETDKVTIDCRSAHAGKVSQLLVKVGDVVKPGHVLCVVAEEATSAASAPAKASAPAPAQTPAPAAASATPTATSPHPPAAATSSTPHHRTPMIHFPPRQAPDGRRISDLSEAESDAVLATIHGAHASHPDTSAAVHPSMPPPAAAAAPPPSQPAAAPAPSAAPGKPETPGARVASGWAPKFKSVARRTLTDREIDLINSGGAFS